jgi:hypothetical protein
MNIIKRMVDADNNDIAVPLPTQSNGHTDVEGCCLMVGTSGHSDHRRVQLWKAGLSLLPLGQACAK